MVDGRWFFEGHRPVNNRGPFANAPDLVVRGATRGYRDRDNPVAAVEWRSRRSNAGKAMMVEMTI